MSPTCRDFPTHTPCQNSGEQVACRQVPQIFDRHRGEISSCKNFGFVGNLVTFIVMLYLNSTLNLLSHKATKFPFTVTVPLLLYSDLATDCLP